MAILKKRKDCIFYIIGARDSEYLDTIKYIVKNNKNIVLIPETSKIQEYYLASDVFVCASYEESFPTIILDAMAFSLPIVTTPVGGIPEQITDGQTGMFYKPGDIIQMQKNILFLIDNPSAANIMGETATVSLKNYFRQEDMLKNHYNLIKTVSFEDINSI